MSKNSGGSLLSPTFLTITLFVQWFEKLLRANEVEVPLSDGILSEIEHGLSTLLAMLPKNSDKKLVVLFTKTDDPVALYEHPEYKVTCRIDYLKPYYPMDAMEDITPLCRPHVRIPEHPAEGEVRQRRIIIVDSDEFALRVADELVWANLQLCQLQNNLTVKDQRIELMNQKLAHCEVLLQSLARPVEKKDDRPLSEFVDALLDNSRKRVTYREQKPAFPFTSLSWPFPSDRPISSYVRFVDEYFPDRFNGAKIRKVVRDLCTDLVVSTRQYPDLADMVTTDAMNRIECDLVQWTQRVKPEYSYFGIRPIYLNDNWYFHYFMLSGEIDDSHIHISEYFSSPNLVPLINVNRFKIHTHNDLVFIMYCG